MKIVSATVLDELTAKAAASPRGRAHYTIHASDRDPVQRFFVAANRGSYFRPHRHHTRSELALVVRGSFTLLTFDDHGVVTGRYVVGADSGNLAYEAPERTWHTLFADADGSAFLEVKEGPYDPATAVEFASWAPSEGDPAVPRFLEWLRSAQPGARAPDFTAWRS